MVDLARIIDLYGDRPLFATSLGSTTYREFGRLVEAARAADRDSPGEGMVAYSMDWAPSAFAGLLALLGNGRNVVLSGELPNGSIAPFAAHAPLLILRTGGTTGRARHVVHRARPVLEGYSVEDRPPLRQMILYSPDHLAGLDSFFQALARGATLVLPPDQQAATLAAFLEEQRVEVLPATPSLLQFLLLSGELEGRDLSALTTIVHGAEPMPPALRLRLQAAFPRARLIERFGLTEMWTLPVAADPDHPGALVLADSRHAWKVEDGELLLKGPNRLLGTLEEGPLPVEADWYATGDLAEALPGGAVRLLGRRESLINVGGEKVLPEHVEALILEQPAVRETWVRGVPNPLTGQAVCAQVVFAGEPEPLCLLQALRQAARERRLPLAWIPTRIETVAEIKRLPSGKRARGPGKA